MKSEIFSLFSLVITGLFILGISSVSMADDGIAICGTGDSQKILRLMAAAFEKANPEGNIEVPDSIGSAAGIKATAAGKCDLGRTARPLIENEKKYDLNYRVFAYSPVAIAVNRSVKGIDNLTSEQIVAIYSGKIKLWSGLGGKKTKIFIVNREASDSSRRLLEKYIPGFKDIKNPAGKIIYTSPEVVKIIRKYPGTIGYGPLVMMVKEKHMKILKVDGVFPSVKSVNDNKYRIVVPLGFVWKGKLNELSGKFFEFIFSPKGQKIINSNGAIYSR